MPKVYRDSKEITLHTQGLKMNFNLCLAELDEGCLRCGVIILNIFINQKHCPVIYLEMLVIHGSLMWECLFSILIYINHMLFYADDSRDNELAGCPPIFILSAGCPPIFILSAGLPSDLHFVSRLPFLFSNQLDYSMYSFVIHMQLQKTP
ncbi:hypothetical protein CHS0354_040287 [Potamilus streckersoni]|uniref:Uncharacterized protein n=1 Tax=Potamilus streckersoni TaxID=2493646 RepID=A0AAE0S3K2_9BIVA|nr:hypothetical protein CHS0354_040287 [Potamilus streckersoni]